MRERNINTRNTRKEEKERDNFNKASILSSLHSMEFIHSLGIDLDGVVRWSFDVCCMVDKTTFQQVSELLYISVSLSHVPVPDEFSSCGHHGWCHEGILHHEIWFYCPGVA